MKNSNLSFIVFVITFFSLVQLSFGHAHVFIDYKVHACINNEGLDGAFINWTYDRMTAQAIEKEFDLNKDKKFDKAEQQKVYSIFFKKNYGKNKYFAIIEVNGQNYSIPEPKNFSARINADKGTIAFTFYFPLKINKTDKKQDVHIYFLDPVIYVAFTVLKKDITIQNKTANVEASIELKQIKYANHPIITFKEK